MIINFYKTNEPYGCFSNFSRHPVRILNKVWPTTEHFFQAMKFEGTEHEDEIREAPTPAIAAKLGRDRSKPLRKDWEEIKDWVMRLAVYEKFTQHSELKSILLSTGDQTLVEHTSNDSYWGDGGDGSGKNMLGKILMETRSKLCGEYDSKIRDLLPSFFSEERMNEIRELCKSVHNQLDRMNTMRVGDPDLGAYGKGWRTSKPVQEDAADCVAALLEIREIV